MRPASGLASALALAAIRGYQRWLSPHKGFGCAFRVATGGDSCSAYGYRVIERFGLRRGLGLLDRRLALCGHVHRSAQAARGPAPPQVRHPLLHYQRGECDPGCALLECGCDACDCGSKVRDCWRSRRQEPARSDNAHFDAIAARVRAQRERRRRGCVRSGSAGAAVSECQFVLDVAPMRVRRSAPCPATPAREWSPAAAG